MRIHPRTGMLLVVLAAATLGQAAPFATVGAQGVLSRIRGTVVDSLGAVAGATVSLAGTAFATVTDRDGRFTIDHVPAGVYAVRAEGGARTAAELADVAMPGDATITVELRFAGVSASVMEPVDDPASGGRISGRQLSRLPIDDPRQALALGSGVVLRGTDVGIAAMPDLSIRGSGADQTAVFIDGAPARFETLGVPQLALGAAAISEVAVIAGVASVAAADARGGAIAYATRAGGSHFDAGLSGGTDGPFSRSATVGFNRLDGFAGGPLPGVRHLTWFISGALYGQSSEYRGRGADTVPTYTPAGTDTTVIDTLSLPGSRISVNIPRFAQVSGTCGTTGNDSTPLGRNIRSNYGYACEGLRLTTDWSTSRRAQAKLLYSYGQGSSVSLTGLLSDFQQRAYPGANLADNGLYTGTRSSSALAVVNWSHALPALAGRALTLAANLWIGSDDYQTGPLDLASDLATRDPPLGIEFSRLRFAGLDGLPLPVTDAIIRALRTNTFKPPLGGRNDLATFQAYRLNPYGVLGGWPTQGLDGQVTVASETRLGGRAGAEWSAAPWLQLRAGVDFSRTEVSFYDAASVLRMPVNAFLAHPRRTGVFAETRLEAGMLVLDAGVRADRYATGEDFPKVPGRIFTNPAARTGDTSYAAKIARTFDPGRVQTLVTPRIRMAARVARRTAVRLGFSQSVEVPPYWALFSNVNADIAYSGGSSPFGRDVSYLHSTLFEAGIRQSFAGDAVLDVSVFNKSNLTPYAFQYQPIFDPFLGGNSVALTLARVDRSWGRGGDVRLEWGEGGPLSGSVSYSLLHTKLPEYTTNTVAGAVALSVPDGWARGSALRSALAGVGADAVLRLTSGTPYTRLINQGVGSVTPSVTGLAIEPLNSSRLPWTKLLDLRVAKTASLGGVRGTFYAEVRNLLSTDNLVALFAETSTDVNDLFRANVIAPQESILRLEAGTAAAPDGTINLRTCDTAPPSSRFWPVDCIALRQVEARFGNGDGFYTPAEQDRAYTSWYDAFYGAWRFHGPARTARVGFELQF